MIEWKQMKRRYIRFLKRQWKKLFVTVHRKEDELAVAIRLTALPEAQMRELALAVQHHTAQAVKDMIGPDKVTVDVTIEDMIAHQTV